MSLNRQINNFDEFGNTPLLYAVLTQDDTAVKQLLAMKADPNVRCAYGNTALMYASDTSVVKLLIEAKADLNIKNDAGNTAIMALNRMKPAVIKEELAKAHADLEITDKSGRTVLEYELSKKNAATSRVLLKYGAKIRSAHAFLKAWGLFKEEPKTLKIMSEACDLAIQAEASRLQTESLFEKKG